MKAFDLKLTCLSLVLITCFFVGRVGAADVDLLLAGQSNSVGRAVPVTADGVVLLSKSRFDKRVKYYYDVDNTAGKFPADSGQTFGKLTTYFNSATKRQELGHEFGASRRLVKTRDKDLAVIKFAVGGAGIWRWQPKGKDYNGFLGAVKDGVQELIDDGHGVNVVGLACFRESQTLAKKCSFVFRSVEKFCHEYPCRSQY